MQVKFKGNILLCLAVFVALVFIFKYGDLSCYSVTEAEEIPLDYYSDIPHESEAETVTETEDNNNTSENVSSKEDEDEETSTELSVDYDGGILDSRTALPAGISLECPNIKVKFTKPLEKGKVSSLFGFRINPVSSLYKFHKGYDIAAAYGTEIKSINDGTVTFIGYDKNGYGNYLKVTHKDGIASLYAHCSKICVKKGDKVKAGQKIALVGSTGGSTGNHLHIEIFVNNVRYDPEWFFGGIYD